MRTTAWSANDYNPIRKLISYVLDGSVKYIFDEKTGQYYRISIEPIDKDEIPHDADPEVNEN